MTDTHAWLTPIVDAVRSHALTTGRFEQFNGHEPADGTTAVQGLVGACWPQDGRPARRSSGLRTTTLVVTMLVRCYTSGQAEPRDDIDPRMLAAVSHLLDLYHGDLTLGGLVRNVDIMGADGPSALGFAFGWMPSTRQRICTITLPLVLSDLWEQER